MAIRIGPPPTLARLRMQWHATCNYYHRQSHAFQVTAAGAASQARGYWRTWSARVGARVSWRARARARQRALYAAFVERYEELVDLLCWAAKDGVHTERDARYAALREWMQLNYHKLRPQLRAHLDAWEGPFDPFEELFAPECIDAVINDIAGITYVMQTRVALEAYSAQLDAAENHRA
jgi:hypothetical protein